MLTNSAVKGAAPKDKPYKLSDSRGLYLIVRPNGSKWWRFDYRRPSGSRNTLSLGVFPDVSLAEARVARDEARTKIRSGADPALARRVSAGSQADTFEAIAREWLALQERQLAPATHAKALWTFEKLLFPFLGSRPIAEVTAPELLAVLRRIEARGHYETTHRARQRAGKVFRFAIATGRAERDIAGDLRDALAPVPFKHRPAITEPRRVGELLRAIKGYAGQVSTVTALSLAPLTFVRPGELRFAEWTEFDFERAEWRIPAPRMKMREEHIVPLSRQALTLLADLQPLTGAGRLLFPSLLSATRPMSENTVNATLRRLGFPQHEMCGHGFRALASTLLNELGWPPDIIELQLAHTERNKVRAAYNRAQRLTERREMMQGWADYLDTLRSGSDSIRIK